MLGVTRSARRQDDAATTEQVKKKIDGVVDEVIADPGAAFQKHAVEPARTCLERTFGEKN